MESIKWKLFVCKNEIKLPKNGIFTITDEKRNQVEMALKIIPITTTQDVPKELQEGCAYII